MQRQLCGSFSAKTKPSPQTRILSNAVLERGEVDWADAVMPSMASIIAATKLLGRSIPELSLP